MKMKIKVLGTRGEILSSHSEYLKHSGVLIDDKILLDVGEKEFMKNDLQGIFITHLHADHAFFVAAGESFISDVPVYAPERPDRFKNMKVISNTIGIGAYKITPIPVTHSIRVKSFGYLVEKNNKRLFYTGDIVSIEKQYFRYIRNLDIVITDASFSRKGGLVRKNKCGEMFGHAGVPDLVSLFKGFTSRIVFTHFGTWFLKDTYAGIQKIKSMQTNILKIDVASDGMEYRI